MKEMVNDGENPKSGWSRVAVEMAGIASPFPNVASQFVDRIAKEVAWTRSSLVETGWEETQKRK
jgi:hypothetical protein